MNSEPEQQFFAVNPIINCPHIKPEHGDNLDKMLDILGQSLCDKKCETEDCSVTSENWVCLECKAVKCSRY